MLLMLGRGRARLIGSGSTVPLEDVAKELAESIFVEAFRGAYAARGRSRKDADEALKKVLK